MSMNEVILRELETLQRVNTAAGQKISDLIDLVRSGQLSAVPAGENGQTIRGGNVVPPADEREFRVWAAASGSVDINLYVQERNKVLEIARSLDPNVGQAFLSYFLRTASTDIGAFFASQGPAAIETPVVEELGKVERMLDSMAGDAGPTEELDALAQVVGEAPSFTNISLMFVNKLSPEINPSFKGFMKPGFKGLKVYRENVMAVPASKLVAWPLGFYGSDNGKPNQFLVVLKSYVVILTDLLTQVPKLCLFSKASGEISAEMELQDLTHNEQAVLEAELRGVLDQYVR